MAHVADMHRDGRWNQVVGRRGFLGRLAAAVAFVSLPAVLNRDAGAVVSQNARGATLVAYRRSSRRSGRRTTRCRACRAHNASRYYATREAAVADRPHPFCDCPVKAHPLPAGAWNHHFRGGTRPIYDERTDAKGVGRAQG